ncbi:MAG: PAS domain S-box protein [Gammaproteobacteria bacterium]|nr:PAS domain S-box protein [Gammaproteobacteria bacterium]
MKLTGLLARSLLNAAPDPIVIVDESGTVVFANALVEDVFGYSPAELVGRCVDVLLPERFRAVHPQHRNRFFASPAPRPMGVELELYALHRAGHEFPVEISLNPVRTDEGLLVSSAIRDVSRQRETERQLADANRAKSRFLAAASHDLRQPLQAMNLLNRAIAKSATGDPERLATIVDRQQKALDSMSSLLDSLLDISKLDAGMIAPRPEHFGVDDVLERLRASSIEQARSKGLALEIERCGAAAHTDPNLLQQVLANLLSNAIRYTDSGSVLLRCSVVDDECLRFDVVDTGPGISEEEQERIFDEFYQIDHGSQRPEGLGLGLSIVHRMTALLGYRLDVRSARGAGSTFSVTVPRGRLPLERDEVAEPPPAAATGLILIVDDERPVAEATQLLLEIEGFRVRIASCESEALAQLSERPPDLIVSDYLLRGGETGLDVVRSVRRASKAEIPAVFVTGDTSKLPAAARELGNAQLLTKPLQAEALLDAIRRQIVAAPDSRG